MRNIAFLAFQNAGRLHADAVALYDEGRYPSAFFLSILSQEEIGKMHIVNDYLWNFDTAEPSVEDEGIERMYIDAIFLHKTKQAHFHRNSPLANSLSARGMKIWKEIEDGVLEGKKQNAAYVGFGRKNRGIDVKGPVRHPWQISKETAKAQITKISDYFLVYGLGVRYTTWSIDNEDVERIWKHRQFLKTLSDLWPHRSRSASMQIRRFQSLLKETIVSP